MTKRAIKSASRKPRSIYLASGKISDYQVEKLIRHFAAGNSAADAHRRMSLSYVTVRRIYEMIRRRLIAAGLFATEERHLSFALAEDNEDAHDADLAAIRRAVGRRRGASARTKPDHIAELLFRQEDDRIVPKRTPDAHARAGEQLSRDIMRIIRKTGPLNRAPDPAALARGRRYVVERFADVKMRALLASLPAAYRHAADLALSSKDRDTNPTDL